MSEFKVGDRVRYIRPLSHQGNLLGNEYEVTKVFNSALGDERIICKGLIPATPTGSFSDRFELVKEVRPEGLVSVMLTDETVLSAVAVAVSRILNQDVKIESLIGRHDYYDPGARTPANPSKWEAKLVKQS